MRKTYVVSAKRSAIGSFLGSLTTVKPVDLGATVVKALLEDGKVAPEQVDELLCGNVLSAVWDRTSDVRLPLLQEFRKVYAHTP